MFLQPTSKIYFLSKSPKAPEKNPMSFIPSSGDESLLKLGAVVNKYTVALCTPKAGPDVLVKASGTLVNIGGHLRIATARHVAKKLDMDGDLTPIIAHGLFPDTAGQTGWGYRQLKVEGIDYLDKLADDIEGIACPHPDVALIKLETTFPLDRYASCWGGVLMEPITEPVFAIGFPDDYFNQVMPIKGNQPTSFEIQGVRIYRMAGLDQGTVVRKSGASSATHRSFSGLSGGGLWAYISNSWHFVGVMFLESSPELVAEAVYAVAANELTKLVR
jgi:hypothetical protein